MAGLRRQTIAAGDVSRVIRGQAIDAPGVDPGEVALFGPDGSLVAVGEAEAGRIAPRRVLAGGPG